MPKPDDLSWHEYLRGYARLRWRNPGDEQRFHEVCGLLQPLHALQYGNLLDKPGPKIVIAERTPRPVQAQGHPPFSFRVQCLITGRVSRYIPYERLIEFGILTGDTQTGGSFPKERLVIEDRIRPVLDRLHADQARHAPYWDIPGTPWHERYDEYLRSEEWLEKREQVLRRDNYRCRYTGKSRLAGDPLQVHHLTYERVGCELLEDLITICRSVHKRLHGREVHT